MRTVDAPTAKRLTNRLAAIYWPRMKSSWNELHSSSAESIFISFTFRVFHCILSFVSEFPWSAFCRYLAITTAASPPHCNSITCQSAKETRNTRRFEWHTCEGREKSRHCSIFHSRAPTAKTDTTAHRALRAFAKVHTEQKKNNKTHMSSAIFSVRIDRECLAASQCRPSLLPPHARPRLTRARDSVSGCQRHSKPPLPSEAATMTTPSPKRSPSWEMAVVGGPVPVSMCPRFFWKFLGCMWFDLLHFNPPVLRVPYSGIFAQGLDCGEE